MKQLRSASPTTDGTTSRTLTRREFNAAIIRGIGLKRRHPTGATPVYACSPCEVTWTGDESDCRRCSRPATTEHTHQRTALQLLLDAVTNSTLQAAR